MSNVVKAVAYVRYSSDNQRDESIEAQIRAINDYAERNEYELIKVYADRAKSATSDKRPEFQQMIKDSDKKNFSYVIVHKLDRFSRDKYDSATYKRKLRNNGVRVVSVLENLDDSPESVILESVIEGMAEYYSKNLAREALKGMKENGYKAMHVGGKAPLGYDVNEEKKYSINEKEAEAVKIIYSMYLNGYSLKSIVNELNERGYKTKLGVQFKVNSLNSILTNEKYTGTYIFNKSSKKDAFGKRNSHLYKDPSEIIRVEGGMPLIIDKETFDKVQEKLKARRKTPGEFKAKEQYLLTSLIKCGECGYSMQGNRRKPKSKPLYVSYRCGGRLKLGAKTCPNKEIRREYIEEFVLSELEKKVFNDNAIPKLVEKINKHIHEKENISLEKSKVIKEKLIEIDNNISNIVNAITMGFTQPEFKDKMQELRNKKLELEQELSVLEVNEKRTQITEEKIKELFKSFRGFITTRNIPECKKFIQDFVKEVRVYKEHIEVIFNVSFSLSQNNEKIKIISKIKRHDLYYLYRNTSI